MGMDFHLRRVRLDPSEKPRDCGGRPSPGSSNAVRATETPPIGGSTSHETCGLPGPATAGIGPGVHAAGGAATPGPPPVSYDREHEGRVDTLRNPERLR